jgi:DHA1 family multidrug resistance protein-like MFS transporter
MVGIQFMMSLALTAIAPVLPIFLPQIGVTGRSAIAFWAGVLTSCNFLIAAFVSPLWGRLGDKHGRKLMVLRSSLAICVFTGLMALVQNVWQLFLLRACMGAFSGFSSTAIALVAGRSPDRRLGMSLGWLATAQLTGGLIGPVVGGTLSDWTGSCRFAFAWTSVLAGCALLVAWRLVPNLPDEGGGREAVPILEGLRILWKQSGLIALFFLLLLAQFSVRAVLPVITLFVQSLLHNTQNAAALAGIAFSVTALADFIASPFLGKRSDIIGYRPVLMICLAGAALMTLPQMFVHSYPLFVAERFGVGLFIGGILPTANALVGRLSPREHKGLAYGVTASASFLGSFLGPLCGGTVAAIFSPRAVFGVTASALLLNLGWLLFAIRPGILEAQIKSAQGPA